jgi:hypothetical protein
VSPGVLRSIGYATKDNNGMVGQLFFNVVLMDAHKQQTFRETSRRGLTYSVTCDVKHAENARAAQSSSAIRLTPLKNELGEIGCFVVLMMFA